VGRRHIRDLIVRLKAEGRTVFFSSHILQDVEMICDRVAILAGGRILRTAAVSEVLYGSVTCYEILASDAPKQLVKKLDLGKVWARGDKTVITIPPDTDLNTGLKRLMAMGVKIESVNPLRQTLEDYFMSELKGHEMRTDRESLPGDTMLANSHREETS
jgi:ABC-2 type transport system ATP-binding protein